MVWRLEISTKDPWLVFDVSCVRTNSDDQHANIVELHACVNHCFDDRPSRFYTDFNKLMVLAILEHTTQVLVKYNLTFNRSIIDDLQVCCHGWDHQHSVPVSARVKESTHNTG